MNTREKQKYKKESNFCCRKKNYNPCKVRCGMNRCQTHIFIIIYFAKTKHDVLYIRGFHAWIPTWYTLLLLPLINSPSHGWRNISWGRQPRTVVMTIIYFRLWHAQTSCFGAIYMILLFAALSLFENGPMRSACSANAYNIPQQSFKRV